MMNIWIILEHLFPTVCVLCGAGGDALPNLCRGCMADLPRPRAPGCPRCAQPMAAAELCGQCQQRPPAYAATTAALAYRGPVVGLVQRFKFDGDLASGQVLGLLLARAARRAPAPELLLPVPLWPARRRARGFDQARELARVVSRELGIAVTTRAARRILERRPQSMLADHEQRRRNVQGVFHVEPARIAGARVALIDDVMTSGATADALAAAALRAGARRVDAWVACRAGA